MKTLNSLRTVELIFIPIQRQRSVTESYQNNITLFYILPWGVTTPRFWDEGAVRGRRSP